jgi:hypothetical protein
MWKFRNVKMWKLHTPTFPNFHINYCDSAVSQSAICSRVHT